MNHHVTQRHAVTWFRDTDRFTADRFVADMFVADRPLRLADLWLADLWLAGLWLATGPLVIRNSATAKDPPRQPEILDQSTRHTGRDILS
jgi:hypothetical protein